MTILSSFFVQERTGSDSEYNF